MSLLSTKNLVFLNMIRYPDLEIPQGKTVFISGESGCGKSTLLRLFNGTLSPSSGTIMLHDTDISALNPIELRRQILLAAQSTFLFDDTIRSNFARFYTYRDLAAPSDNTIGKWLKLCCADFSPDTACASLSGGERQRVYLSLFLSFAPLALLLDEPTSALDSATSRSLLGNLKEFCSNQGITLIIVSHDQQLIQNFADTIITLEKGGVPCRESLS